MRSKINPQGQLDFSRPTSKLTSQYYQKFEKISNLLDDNPKMLQAIHRDLQEPLKYTGSEKHEGGHCKFTSENILRVLIVMILEAMSLRRVVVLVDDSDFLRRFTRIYDQADT